MDVTIADRIAEIDPVEASEGYHRSGLDAVPDAVLVDAAASLVARPRSGELDSFQLHAPLELLARASLLQRTSPQARELARIRIVWEAATYVRSGEPWAPVPATCTDVATALDALSDAIGAGDLDDAAAIGGWLGAEVDPSQLSALVGDLVAPSLAAAAHGSIFLHLLPRLGARSRRAGSMLASLARELARNPSWQIRWFDDVDLAAAGPSNADDLASALADTPVISRPESLFIHPMMVHCEAAGVPTSVLSDVLGGDVRSAGRAMLRISTESMLRDDVSHAPYGWSHCLTMPQAVVAIAPELADPRRALAVAASHIVGFRSTLGARPLSELRSHGAAERLNAFTLDAEPTRVAATIAAARPSERSAMWQSVVDLAAGHHDAHLVKYVSACGEAAQDDPEFAHQHLAAAGHLASVWLHRGADDDTMRG